LGGRLLHHVKRIAIHRSLRILGYQAIGVIAHRLCQLIWILLHRKVRYEERGPAVTETSKRKRTASMVRELLSLAIMSPRPHFNSKLQHEDFRA
jgi:hypothetical protein